MTNVLRTATPESLPDDAAIHRREFLGGGWLRPRTRHNRRGRGGVKPVAAASILVHARPERLIEVEQAIAAKGLDVSVRHPLGRLVLAVATADPEAISAALNAVACIPGVVTAALMNSPPAGTMSA